MKCPLCRDENAHFYREHLLDIFVPHDDVCPGCGRVYVPRDDDGGYIVLSYNHVELGPANGRWRLPTVMEELRRCLTPIASTAGTDS